MRREPSQSHYEYPDVPKVKHSELRVPQRIRGPNLGYFNCHGSAQSPADVLLMNLYVPPHSTIDNVLDQLETW